MGELQRPVVTAIEHLPKPPPKNYGSNETNTNDRWGVYPHYPCRFGDNLRNGFNWNTSISMNNDPMTKEECREQLQEDIITFLDGMDDGIIGHLCDIVIENFAKLDTVDTDRL